MEKSNTYRSIKVTEYSFTAYEVLMAVIEKYKISLESDYEFYLFGTDEEPIPPSGYDKGGMALITRNHKPISKENYDDITFTIVSKDVK